MRSFLSQPPGYLLPLFTFSLLVLDIESGFQGQKSASCSPLPASLCVVRSARGRGRFLCSKSLCVKAGDHKIKIYDRLPEAWHLWRLHKQRLH